MVCHFSRAAVADSNNMGLFVLEFGNLAGFNFINSSAWMEYEFNSVGVSGRAWAVTLVQNYKLIIYYFFKILDTNISNLSSAIVAYDVINGTMWPIPLPHWGDYWHPIVSESDFHGIIFPAVTTGETMVFTTIVAILLETVT